MPHQQYEPHPALKEYLLCLWTTEREFVLADQWFDILPDSHIELVFTFGKRCQLDDGTTQRELPRCCVVGLLDKPFRLRADGRCHSIGARFFAWGFYPLIGIDMMQPGTIVQPLGAVWHSLSERIEHAVQRDDSAAAVGLLHEFLLQRALKAQADQTMFGAATRLFRHNGQVKISDVAQRAFLSRRQLERKFNATLGVSPKSLARRMRFEHVRNRLYDDPHADLAALAQECGYADQAHCIREFKQFSNRTPKQFAADMGATRALFTSDAPADNVAIIQDP